MPDYRELPEGKRIRLSRKNGSSEEPSVNLLLEYEGTLPWGTNPAEYFIDGTMVLRALRGDGFPILVEIETGEHTLETKLLGQKNTYTLNCPVPGDYTARIRFSPWSGCFSVELHTPAEVSNVGSSSQTDLPKASRLKQISMKRVQYRSIGTVSQKVRWGGYTATTYDLNDVQTHVITIQRNLTPLHPRQLIGGAIGAAVWLTLIILVIVEGRNVPYWVFLVLLLFLPVAIFMGIAVVNMEKREMIRVASEERRQRGSRKEFAYVKEDNWDSFKKRLNRGS